MKIQPNLSDGQAQAMLRRWFVEDKGTTVVRVYFIVLLISLYLLRDTSGILYVSTTSLIWQTSVFNPAY